MQNPLVPGYQTQLSLYAVNTKYKLKIAVSNKCQVHLVPYRAILWRSLENWNSVVYIKVLVAKNLLQNINVVPAAENYSKTWRFISGSIFSFLFRSERPSLKKKHLYSIFTVQCTRLCSTKNWREPSALNLQNPVCPAYDFYEKAKIF